MDNNFAIIAAQEYIDNFDYSIEFCDSYMIRTDSICVYVCDTISRSFLDYFIRVALEDKSIRPVSLITESNRIKKLFVAVAVINRFHVRVKGFDTVPNDISYLSLLHAGYLPALEVGNMKTQMLFLRMKDDE
jgi:hypothetical protein